MAKADTHWLDLECGGAVLLSDGIPLKVTDKGDWSLDEATILAEAIQITNSNIEWFSSDRSKRWRKQGLTALLSNKSTWCFAKVLRKACEACGDEVGETYVFRTERKMWVGKSCHANQEQIED